MVRQVSEIVTQMREALALSEPELDTTIGTPVRKILDAVAETVAEAYVDRHLLTYQYDIDTKTGADLDEFVRLFGFTRFAAKRAVGTVTFERATPATQPILIPINTQLATEGIEPIVVQTTTAALILEGETNVQVPVQAVNGGSAGNIPASSIKRQITQIESITSFTNPAALTGGADAEDDEQLRSRFKATVFRSMAGTEQMFLGIALNDDAVTQANVIGSAKVRRESVELVSGNAVSTVQDAKYIYPDSEVVGTDIDNGFILTRDVHYTFNPIIPPEVDSVGASHMPDGVYDLQFEYVPQASRNDPDAGLTNRVDVYINGLRSTEASETVVYDQARVFNTTPGDPLNIANFQREDGSQPVVGNRFVAFAFAPVIDPAINNIIVIDAQDYTQDGTTPGEAPFFLVNDITNQGGTYNSLSGIEIVSVTNGAPYEPSPTALFQVNYLFNSVPRDVEVAAREWRLITTDVRVHQAKPMLLNLYMAVIFERGYPVGSVQPRVEAELSRYISTVGFGQVVQVSDLLEVATRVGGVDAIRFLTDQDDATNFAIQRVNSAGAVLETYATDEVGQTRRALDVLVGDDEYPVFNSLTLVAKAQNTMGPV